MTPDELRAKIREIPDFPKPGILFYDITTLLKDAEAYKAAIDAMVAPYAGDKIDIVVGMESRGFIFSAPLAYLLGAGLVPVRKLGKLPAETISVEYALEYGSNTLEIHRDAIAARPAGPDRRRPPRHRRDGQGDRGARPAAPGRDRGPRLPRRARVPARAATGSAATRSPPSSRTDRDEGRAQDADGVTEDSRGHRRRARRPHDPDEAIRLGRRRFFRAFASDAMRTAANVVGVAGALQKTSAEVAGAILTGSELAPATAVRGHRSPRPPRPATLAPSPVAAGAVHAFRSPFRFDDDALVLLDQRRLPGDLLEVVCRTAVDLRVAIIEGVVRGASILAQTLRLRDGACGRRDGGLAALCEARGPDGVGEPAPVGRGLGDAGAPGDRADDGRDEPAARVLRRRGRPGGGDAGGGGGDHRRGDPRPRRAGPVGVRAVRRGGPGRGPVGVAPPDPDPRERRRPRVGADRDRARGGQRARRGWASESRSSSARRGRRLPGPG